MLFNRMKRKNQVNWEYVPELLQHIASELNQEDHDRFCEWVCNPSEIRPGNPGYFAELCQSDRAGIADDEKSPIPIPISVVHEASDRTPADHNTMCDNYSSNADISVELNIQASPTKL